MSSLPVVGLAVTHYFVVDCHRLGIAALVVAVVVRFGRVAIRTASSSSSSRRCCQVRLRFCSFIVSVRERPSFILSLSVDLGGGWQRGRIRFAAEKWSHQFDHCCCFVVELFLGSSGFGRLICFRKIEI